MPESLGLGIVGVFNYVLKSEVQLTVKAICRAFNFKM